MIVIPYQDRPPTPQNNHPFSFSLGEYPEQCQAINVSIILITS